MKPFLACLFVGTALWSQGTPGKTVFVQEQKALRLETAHELKKLELKVGHAAISLHDGKAARAFDGDRCVGFFFEGSGGIDYVSAVPEEHALLRYDLEHGTKAAPTAAADGLHVATSFKRAFIWMSGHEQAPFDGAAADSLDPAFQAHAERFSFADVSTPGAAALAQTMNDPSHPWIRAELDGGPETWLYEWNPAQSRTETLTLLKKAGYTIPATEKILDPHLLSSQPIGWNYRKPEGGPYMLTRVDVDLTAEGEHEKLKVQETVHAMRPGVRLLTFNLENEYLDDKGKWRYLKVTKVADKEGKPLEFAQTRGEVSVAMPQALEAGAAFDLAFEIEGDTLLRPGRDNYWQLSEPAWFPQPGLNGEHFTWHSVIRVAKPWIAFSNGDTVRRWEEGGFNAVETKSETPIAFGVVLAGDYTIERETRNGLTVEVATYSSRAQFSKALMDMAFLTVKYYSDWMGAYPFKEFHILEKNQWGYGQAPATIMFITKEAFNQSMPDKDIGKYVGLVAEDVRHRFVHEIAHQWWGTIVKMPSFDEQWITESFAEASAGMCLADWPKGHAKGELAKLKAQWKSRAEEASPRSTIPTANRIYNPGDSREAFMTRTGLIYDKGAWL
ncbi:MAG TPA: M1 family aminopeptidase, partial [Holophagaceae bacterium]|nr:M1 family aminopeptidase [Holophagaceae bacterium]